MIEINLHRSGNSLQGASPLGDGTGGFTPFLNYNFTGANGDTGTLSEFDSTSTKRYYSTEQALAPNTSSLRCDVFAGQNYFGGGLKTPTAWPAFVEGDTFWVRMYQYFPSTFCAGYGTTSGDGWGATKWFRIQWGDENTASYSRLTFQIGNITSGACSTGPTFRGCTMETFNGAGNAWFPTELAIPKDQWVAMQFCVYIHPTNGYIRGWMDDQYAGQVDIVTVPDALQFGINNVKIGDYWNGSPHQDSQFYMQEVVMATGVTTLDSGGRPYIPPSMLSGDIV